jgi:hypothetical protein
MNEREERGGRMGWLGREVEEYWDEKMRILGRNINKYM